MKLFGFNLQNRIMYVFYNMTQFMDLNEILFMNVSKNESTWDL